MTIEQTKASPLTILLAEDNEVNLFFLRSIIEQHFQQVHILEAEDGAAAIDHYKTYLPDLILMDLNMPLVKGDAAARAIRKLAEVHGHHPKIVLLSGSILSQEDPLLDDIPIDAYLLKPFQAEALKALIDDQLSPPQGMVEGVYTEGIGEVDTPAKHFDFEELLQALGGDHELVREVLIHTQVYLAEFLAKFEYQLSAKNLLLIHQLTHDLGGVAANAHLDALLKLAREMEQKKTFTAHFFQDKLEEIKKEINVLLPILSNYTEQNSSK